jgi:hypothetical protein
VKDRRAMTTDDPRVRTLGERLDEIGRRLAARHLPVYPWAGGLRRVLERAASLAAMSEGRFERVEWPPGDRDLTAFVERTAGARGPVGSAPVPPVAGPRPAAVPPAAGDGARVDEGRPLPADVRSRLRDVAGRGADDLRVHDDGAADALARTHRADAVTVGRDVYFRDGRYRPRQERGFALLAHEATHVLALLRPWSAWRRTTNAGAADEERDARTAERDARRARDPAGRPGAASGGWPPPAGADAGTRPPPPAAPRSADATLPAAAARPMAAPVDRAEDVVAAPAPLDLDSLRRELIDDLMRQLRVEFERGG